MCVLQNREPENKINSTNILRPRIRSNITSGLASQSDYSTPTVQMRSIRKLHQQHHRLQHRSQQLEPQHGNLEDLDANSSRGKHPNGCFYRRENFKQSRISKGNQNSKKGAISYTGSRKDNSLRRSSRQRSHTVPDSINRSKQISIDRNAFEHRYSNPTSQEYQATRNLVEQVPEEHLNGHSRPFNQGSGQLHSPQRHFQYLNNVTAQQPLSAAFDSAGHETVFAISCGHQDPDSVVNKFCTHHISSTTCTSTLQCKSSSFQTTLYLLWGYCTTKQLLIYFERHRTPPSASALASIAHDATKELELLANGTRDLLNATPQNIRDTVTVKQGELVRMMILNMFRCHNGQSGCSDSGNWSIQILDTPTTLSDLQQLKPGHCRITTVSFEVVFRWPLDIVAIVEDCCYDYFYSHRSNERFFSSTMCSISSVRGLSQHRALATEKQHLLPQSQSSSHSKLGLESGNNVHSSEANFSQPDSAGQADVHPDATLIHQLPWCRPHPQFFQSQYRKNLRNSRQTAAFSDLLFSATSYDHARRIVSAAGHSDISPTISCSHNVQFNPNPLLTDQVSSSSRSASSSSTSQPEFSRISTNLRGTQSLPSNLHQRKSCGNSSPVELSECSIIQTNFKTTLLPEHTSHWHIPPDRKVLFAWRSTDTFDYIALDKVAFGTVVFMPAASADPAESFLDMPKQIFQSKPVLYVIVTFNDFIDVYRMYYPDVLICGISSTTYRTEASLKAFSKRFGTANYCSNRRTTCWDSSCTASNKESFFGQDGVWLFSSSWNQSDTGGNKSHRINQAHSPSCNSVLDGSDSVISPFIVIMEARCIRFLRLKGNYPSVQSSLSTCTQSENSLNSPHAPLISHDINSSSHSPAHCNSHQFSVYEPICLKDVLQDILSAPDIEKFACVGISRWGSKKTQTEMPFIHGPAYSFVLVNTQATIGIDFSGKTKAWEDLEFNERMHEFGRLVVCYTRYVVVCSRITNGNSRWTSNSVQEHVSSFDETGVADSAVLQSANACLTPTPSSPTLSPMECHSRTLTAVSSAPNATHVSSTATSNNLIVQFQIAGLTSSDGNSICVSVDVSQFRTKHNSTSENCGPKNNFDEVSNERYTNSSGNSNVACLTQHTTAHMSHDLGNKSTPGSSVFRTSHHFPGGDYKNLFDFRGLCHAIELKLSDRYQHLTDAKVVSISDSFRLSYINEWPHPHLLFVHVCLRECDWHDKIRQRFKLNLQHAQPLGLILTVLQHSMGDSFPASPIAISTSVAEQPVNRPPLILPTCKTVCNRPTNSLCEMMCVTSGEARDWVRSIDYNCTQVRWFVALVMDMQEVAESPYKIAGADIYLYPSIGCYLVDIEKALASKFAQVNLDKPGQSLIPSPQVPTFSSSEPFPHLPYSTTEQPISNVNENTPNRFYNQYHHHRHHTISTPRSNYHRENRIETNTVPNSAKRTKSIRVWPTKRRDCSNVTSIEPQSTLSQVESSVRVQNKRKNERRSRIEGEDGDTASSFIPSLSTNPSTESFSSTKSNTQQKTTKLLVVSSNQGKCCPICEGKASPLNK